MLLCQVLVRNSKIPCKPDGSILNFNNGCVLFNAMSMEHGRQFGDIIYTSVTYTQYLAYSHTDTNRVLRQRMCGMKSAGNGTRARAPDWLHLSSLLLNLHSNITRPANNSSHAFLGCLLSNSAHAVCIWSRIARVDINWHYYASGKQTHREKRTMFVHECIFW